MTRSSTVTIEATASSSSLRHILREALALGAGFRLCGTAVQIENFTTLPQTCSTLCTPMSATSGR